MHLGWIAHFAAPQLASGEACHFFIEYWKEVALGLKYPYGINSVQAMLLL
jgi:hypothetical protein